MATQDTCVTPVPYFKAKDGKLAEFKALSEQLVQKSKEDPGCLYCGFSFDGDEALCREGYRDADAWLAHLQSVGAIFGEILGVADITRLEIHGTEAQLAKVRKPLADMGMKAQLFTLETGFRR